MKQQINLYRQSVTWFHLTERTVFLSYGIFIFLLGIHFFYLLWENHVHAKQVVALEQTLQEKKKTFAEMIAQFPMINPADLQNSLQELQKQLVLRMKIFATLNQGAGFYNRLNGLGEGILPGVWLTKITFSNQEQSMNLVGFGLTSLVVQQYLDELAKQSTFSSMLFSLQELALVTLDPAKQYGYLSFRATSKATMLL